MFIGKQNSLVIYYVLEYFIFKDIFPSLLIHGDSYFQYLNKIIFYIIGNIIDMSLKNIPFLANFFNQAKQFFELSKEPLI